MGVEEKSLQLCSEDLAPHTRNAVNYTVGEYLHSQALTNESFLSMLKRGRFGTPHGMSDQHRREPLEDYNPCPLIGASEHREPDLSGH